MKLMRSKRMGARRLAVAVFTLLMLCIAPSISFADSTEQDVVTPTPGIQDVDGTAQARVGKEEENASIDVERDADENRVEVAAEKTESLPKEVEQSDGADGRDALSGDAQKQNENDVLAAQDEKKQSIASAAIDPISNQAYTGSPVTPEPVVKLNGQQLKKETDYTVSYQNNQNAGTAIVKVQGIGAYEGEKEAQFQIVAPKVSYRVHVQTYGDQQEVSDGEVAGTSGESKRLEGAWMSLSGAEGGIEYRTHVQREGWQGWVADGAMAGTEGRSLRLEAMQARLTGAVAETHSVWYRVHAQTYGWLGWASDGEEAGTDGLSRRLEAMQVVVLPKGERPSDSLGDISPALAAPCVSAPAVEYRTHVQREGWQDWVADGAAAGTEGRSLRLEGLEARLSGGSAAGGVEYRTHVQGDGWQDWVADGAMAGTEGRSLRLEAACVRLAGEASELFDVWYRVHAQTYGWLGWASNGDPAGTEGLSRRLEAIEVRLTAKGSGAPGSTDGAFIKNGSAGATMLTVSGERNIVSFGEHSISQDAANRLNDAINGLRGQGYDVGFMMMDLGTGKGVAYNCDGVFYGASSIKAPYIASVASRHPEVVSAYQHDIQETLFYSWDFNYKQVYYAYGKDPMREMCQESGANPSIAESLPWANYSARDLALLWNRSYELYFQSPAVERVGTWCERPNVSTIHHTVGGKYRTRSKGGWIADGGVSTPSVNGGGPLWNVSDDGGIVYADNGPYVVAIMSSVPANHDMLDQLTDAIDGAHAEIS